MKRLIIPLFFTALAIGALVQVAQAHTNVSDGAWYFGVGQVTVPAFAAPNESALTANAQPTSAPATAVPPSGTPVPAVAPTLGVPATPVTPGPNGAANAADQTVVVLAGVLEALVIAGILVYLFRTAR